MSTVFIDFETRSVASIKVGAYRYAADPTTEILCAGYAIDDGEPQIWVPGQQPVPDDIIKLAKDRTTKWLAHNFMFERAIMVRKLTPLYGWPEIPLDQQFCTMSMALACALPGELDAAAMALGLPYQKDRDGYRLMRQMSQPRRPRKGEDRTKIYWVDDPEKRKRLYAYCKRDAEVERALSQRLPMLSAREQEHWRLDAVVNERGFYIDLDLVHAARAVAGNEQDAINAELLRCTDGEIKSVHQRDKIIAFVRRHGHTLEKLTKRSVAAVLAHGPNEIVQHVLELRRDSARASVRKLDNLLKSIDADGRMRSTLRYMGSSTGRWSGRGYQPQNLKKSETADIDAAIEAILSQDTGRIRELGAPLTVAGDVSRAMICAAPGHRLIGGDFSAVESRILAGIAGEQWKLDNYREYDATGQPELEPYCATATRMLKRTVMPDDEAGRTIGKTADLARGYHGALGAWRRFNPDDERPDGEVLLNIQEWRRAHPAIVRLWKQFESAALRAVRTGQRVNVGNLFAFTLENGTLFMWLPSGRRLAYPEARIGPGKYEDTCQVYFKDNARGGWKDCRGWSGSFVENAVQALSRDLLAAAMQRLEAAGYPVVLHVHDEIICEVPDGFGSNQEFHALMVQAPSGAAGLLPIAAKVWSGPRYVKTKSAIVPKPTATPKPTAAPTPIPIAAAPPVEETDDETSWDVSLVDLIGEPVINGKILCPFHEDHRPSLAIYDDHYFCYVCGARGDHLDWLVQVEGMERETALQTLKTWDGPRQIRTPDNGALKRERALKLWEQARPIAGTLAARYLTKTRGIDLTALPTTIDDALRFHPHCSFGLEYHPCLLALMRNISTDEPTGIHRIALTSDAKKIDRFMLGRSGAVKLWPAGTQLVIGEGIETVLAAATRPDQITYEVPLWPAWALLSADALGRFPFVPNVERLIVLADHDPAGKTAASLCVGRYQRFGRNVVQLMPDEPGFDFNDLVMPECA